MITSSGYLTTSPPVSPSPYKERGRGFKRGGFAPSYLQLPFLSPVLAKCLLTNSILYVILD